MPGIVGLVTRMPRQRAERELHRMVAILRHEEFYETGTWLDESLGVYLGWSARRDSASARLPLRDETGSIALVLSGEELSAADGAEDLVRRAGDDPAFPAGLNGRFHGVLIDRARASAMLFNDRYGMHRVYYHAAADGFYFAAEAKAILAVRPALGGLEPRALGEFLTCGCVLENRTLFAGIHVLPGAARWLLRDGAVEHQAAYFRPDEWEAQPALDPQRYYSELRDVFARALPRYFAGREAIGISLSGGLDTRMIMARLAAGTGPLPCYTFASMYRDSADVRVAQEVARACGQPHQIIRVGTDFLTRYPAYAERTVYLTDGCTDVSRAADLYVNQTARQIAPVRMTGNYGGEVLRRVRAFKPVAPAPGFFSAALDPWLRHAQATYAGLLHGHPLSFAVFRQAPWHHHGLLALEETQLALRSPYLDNELVQTVFRAPPSACADDRVCRDLIADAHPTLAQIPTDRGVGGGGAFALPTRALRELQFKAEYAYDYGMPQWIAPIDRVLSPLHPERLFLGRHKFAHYRLWYRTVLAEYVREVALDRGTLALPYFERKTVEAAVNDHLAGRRNYTVEIHRLLTLALVHRLFTSSSAALRTPRLGAVVAPT
jgi:asparagine synthase (glutamine-hydrolysing)